MHCIPRPGTAKQNSRGWLAACNSARPSSDSGPATSWSFFFAFCSFLIFFSGSSLAVKVHALISQGMTQGCLYRALSPRFTQSAAKISISQQFIDLLHNLYKKASYYVAGYSCYSHSPIDAFSPLQTSSLSIFPVPHVPLYSRAMCHIHIPHPSISYPIIHIMSPINAYNVIHTN